MPARTTPTRTDGSLRALREAKPRHTAGFDQSLERYHALRTQITASVVAAPSRAQLAGRRRVMRISAAAGAALSLAGVLLGLTLSAASPQGADAQARKAIAATSSGAVHSGTVTLTFVGVAGHRVLQTTRWNGTDMSITGAHLSRFGASQVRLTGTGAYLQRADGTWVHYARSSDLGLLRGIVQVARTLVNGSRAQQILALVPGLHKSVMSDGSVSYSGTIPTRDSSQTDPTDDSATELAAALKSAGNDAQLQLTVGSDGLVKRMSEIADHRTRIWTIQYSQVGATPPVSAPKSFSQAAPGSVPTPVRTTAPIRTTS